MPSPGAASRQGVQEGSCSPTGEGAKKSRSRRADATALAAKDADSDEQDASAPEGENILTPRDGYGTDAAIASQEEADPAFVDSDFKIFPRRKGGQTRKCAESAPVIITAELLQSYYGMPLVRAAKKLGICTTALKKVCRKLGIHKWPYKEMKPSLSLSLCRQGNGSLAAATDGRGATEPRAETVDGRNTKAVGVAGRSKAGRDDSKLAGPGRGSTGVEGGVASPPRKLASARGSCGSAGEKNGVGASAAVSAAGGDRSSRSASLSSLQSSPGIPFSPLSLQPGQAISTLEERESMAGLLEGLAAAGRGELAKGHVLASDAFRHLPSLLPAAPGSIHIPSLHELGSMNTSRSLSSRGGVNIPSLQSLQLLQSCGMGQETSTFSKGSSFGPSEVSPFLMSAVPGGPDGLQRYVPALEGAKGGGQEEQRQRWQEVGAGAKARRGFSGTGSHRRKLPPEAGTGEVEAAGTIARDGRGREDGGEMDQERKSVEMGQEASVGGSQGVGGGGGLSDYTVFPRRKVGRSSRAPGGGNSRAPVVLSEEKLRECFDLPLHVASKKMGICITAIKKVCRKLGIHKWPYRELKERKAAIKGRGGDADVAGSVGADTGLVEHQRVSGRRSEGFAEPTRRCSTRKRGGKGAARGYGSGGSQASVSPMETELERSSPSVGSDSGESGGSSAGVDEEAGQGGGNLAILCQAAFQFACDGSPLISGSAAAVPPLREAKGEEGGSKRSQGVPQASGAQDTAHITWGNAWGGVRGLKRDDSGGGLDGPVGVRRKDETSASSATTSTPELAPESTRQRPDVCVPPLAWQMQRSSTDGDEKAVTAGTRRNPGRIDVADLLG